MFGEPGQSIDKRFYVSDFIKYSFKSRSRISPDALKIIIDKYQDGWSLGDIASLIGCSKNKVRIELKKSKIAIRSSVAQATNRRPLKSAKQKALPYYGFCYFEGKIIKDPREFPVLNKIHFMWEQKKTIHQITQALNQQGIGPRRAKAWSWLAVKNIVDRFNQEKILLKEGGEYEFR